MVRLARWRFVLAAAMVLAIISSPEVRAQDAGPVMAATPTAAAVADTDTAAPVATDAATMPLPLPTEAAPVVTEAATIPAPTETPAPLMVEAAPKPVEIPTPTSPPMSTEAAPMASTAVSPPVSTDAPTTQTISSSTSQVAADTSPTMVQDSTSSRSSLRGSPSSSSLRDVSATTTGTLEGSSTTKILVIAVLGGVGLTIIMSLLFAVRRIRTRQDADLGTPPPPDTGTITFPAVSMPSVVPPTAPWKASGSSFSSRDLPLSESTRAKLNATTRSSTEYDMADQPSQIVSLFAPGATMQTPQAARGTNASSEQSFSIRGYSEFSVLHGGDSESSTMANDRISTNDGYSMSDRYSSTHDRYSTSSRLSSEPGRSNSGWFQRQVPKNVDMHRFSSTSSTASSVVTRKHNPATLITHDLTQTPSVEAPVDTDSTTSRTDIPDWYSVIESPTDTDRYTASSLDSDNVSNERESFEL